MKRTDRSEDRVYSVKRHNSLDSLLRKLIHRPRKIVGKYIKEGMVVLDIGCGPGFFTIEIAKIVGQNGKVIAVDLQQEMLDILKKKLIGKEIEKSVILHKCSKNSIGVSEKVDFALAFYVIHEIESQEVFFSEIKSILKHNGLLMIVEPSFKVTNAEFENTLNKAAEIGFMQIDKPKILFSRAVVLKKNQKDIK